MRLAYAWPSDPSARATHRAPVHAAAVVLFSMVASACSDGTGPEPGQPVDANGGVVAAFGDSVRLVVPSGALAATVRITVDRVDPPPAGAGLVPGTVVDFGPDTTTFTQPVMLEVRYDPAAVPGGMAVSDLRLHSWNGASWEELPAGSAHDAANHRITGQVTGLGRYGIKVASASSVQLSDTALGPITALVPRPLVARAYDARGVRLEGAPLVLASLDPAVAAAEAGLAVRGVTQGTARMMLSSGTARDTLAIDATFGWRAISLTRAGNAPFHGCGIGQDDVVYCWGQNQDLQGGRATADSAMVPMPVPGLPPVAGDPKIVAGAGATCYSPGTGWVCWGLRRLSGEDVPGSALPRDAAWLLDGRLHLGYNGACVTPVDGAARCWGVSPGDGSPPSSIRWTPQAVHQPGGAWKIVRPGLNVVCGVTTQHRAYCWGPNVAGSSGSGLPPAQYQENVPNAVASSLDFAEVRPGPDFACGLTTDGDVWCWGKNRAGLMGDTTAIPDTPVPVHAPIGALRFPPNGLAQTFGVGSLHACGLTSDGTAYCWGRGAEGAVGTGSSDYALAPTPVAGGHRFRTLAIGGIVTCGITPYGAAYCWGFNYQGMLGVGTVPHATAQLAPALLTVP